MNPTTARFLLALVATTLLVAPGAASAPQQEVDAPGHEQGPPALPPTPARPTAIVSAQPFLLDTPFLSEWRKERPSVDAGWIVVLEAPSAMLYPRQVAEPVLYAGRQAVERVNIGFASGRLIAIVAGKRAADGSVEPNLAELPLFFGAPALPEQVDLSATDVQIAAAAAQGVKPFSAAAIETARGKGGPTIHAPNKDDLLRQVAALVRQHAPDEVDLADALEAR